LGFPEFFGEEKLGNYLINCSVCPLIVADYSTVSIDRYTYADI
jgi:hypothetical protein